MSWCKFDDGKTIGQKGSESGEILFDEEHELGSRITLEKRRDYFAFTCGIYGWFFHTRFLSELVAKSEYEKMKADLDRILNLIPTVDDLDESKMAGVSEEISEFIEKYP